MVRRFQSEAERRQESADQAAMRFEDRLQCCRYARCFDESGTLRQGRGPFSEDQAVAVAVAMGDEFRAVIEAGGGIVVEPGWFTARFLAPADRERIVIVPGRGLLR